MYGAHAWLLSPPCQPYTRQGEMLLFTVYFLFFINKIIDWWISHDQGYKSNLVMLGHFRFSKFSNLYHILWNLLICYLWKMLLDLRSVQDNIFSIFFSNCSERNFLPYFFSSFFLVSDLRYSCKNDWDIGQFRLSYARVYSEPTTVRCAILQAALLLLGSHHLLCVHARVRVHVIMFLLCCFPLPF